MPWHVADSRPTPADRVRRFSGACRLVVRIPATHVAEIGRFRQRLQRGDSLHAIYTKQQAEHSGGAVLYAGTWPTHAPRPRIVCGAWRSTLHVCAVRVAEIGQNLRFRQELIASHRELIYCISAARQSFLPAVACLSVPRGHKARLSIERAASAHALHLLIAHCPRLLFTPKLRRIFGLQQPAYQQSRYHHCFDRLHPNAHTPSSTRAWP